MKKRYAVLGLSVFLALALAVPALGGPSNPIASVSASVKSTANKALKKAKSAEKTAKTALSTADSANSLAGTVQTEAKKAQTTANTAQTEAKKAQTTANEGKANAATAKSAADAAKAVAEEAKASAAERIRFSSEQIGTANPSTGTNTTTPKSASVECPAGQEVLGGGFFVNGEPDKVAVHTSNPSVFYANGWFVEGAAIAGTPTWSIQADVMCGVK